MANVIRLDKRYTVEECQAICDEVKQRDYNMNLWLRLHFS